MKILCLYGNKCALDLWDWLESQGHTVNRFKEKLNEDWLRAQSFDMAISYTYPYIVKQGVIDILNGNIVNLHTSYLPFNRGSYPNVWSILEETPRGVTLHYIDTGLDSGDIISQALVPIKDGQTLQSSYDELDEVAKDLFKSSFVYYGYWNDLRKKPSGRGTFHSDKQLLELKDQFEQWDWEMKVEELINYLKRKRRNEENG